MTRIIGILIGKALGPWQRIDAEGNSIDVQPGFFDDHQTYAGIADEVIDDQHMVRIPAFHYRAGAVTSGEHAGKKALWISPEPAAGFELHPAFRHHGAELPHIWVGKYQGTPDDDKLGSQPGLKPLASINFPTMQARASARNTDDTSGFMLWSIYQLAAIQTLALIELGTPDMQAAIGEGNVHGNGVREVDDETVAQATWRGIVGLWGNVWQMVDGLQTSGDREYRIWATDGSQTYIETEVEAPGDGWFRRRSTEHDEGFDLGAVFLPVTTREDRDESAFGDYFWSYHNAVAYHGANWGYGRDAGLFYLGVGSGASVSSSGIGGRLAKV
jgi:hypothetical protein